MMPKSRVDPALPVLEDDGETLLPSRFLREFARSLPARYHELFDDVALREHAAIAYRRRIAPAHVEVWGEPSEPSDARSANDRVYPLCIVTDDRPGLLSLISAALVVHDLDVVAAQAYCRPIRCGSAEVVDFFWVRRTKSDPFAGDPDVASIADVLGSLVQGTTTVNDVAKRAAHARRARAAGGTRVRFDGDDKDGLAVLLIEAWDRPGLLLAMTRSLYEQRVQIMRSEIRTVDGRALNRFELAEFDGLPLGRERRLQVQVEVLAVLESGGARSDDE
jgi:[protein-PII] uridylyltransferase